MLYAMGSADQAVWTLGRGKCGLLPSEKDVEFYEEHGWFVSPIVIPPRLISEARLGAERFYAGDQDWSLPVPLAKNVDWTSDDADGLRMNDFIAFRKREITGLVQSTVVAAIAAKLARADQIRLFTTTLVVKAPYRVDESRVGWHTDRAYWRSCTSEKMITAWVPLQSTSASLGPLCVVDGSHAWDRSEIVDSVRLTRSFDEQGDLALVRLRAAGFPVRVVQLELQAGQVSFHHCLTLHGSPGNLSDEYRYAVSVHLQDGENRYQEIYDNRGSLHRHNVEDYVRRDENTRPDFTDPYFCPLLWDDQCAGAPSILICNTEAKGETDHG